MFLQTTAGHNRGPPQQTYILFRIKIAHLQNREILNNQTKKKCLKKRRNRNTNEINLATI